MRVGIPGSGGKLGTIFARAGHAVVFSYARQPEEVGGACAGCGAEGAGGRRARPHVKLTPRTAHFVYSTLRLLQDSCVDYLRLVKLQDVRDGERFIECLRNTRSANEGSA